MTQVESKADFIALGDVICKNHQSRTEDLESQTIDLGRIDSKAKAHQVAGLLRQQADNLAAEAHELGALQPPPGDAERVGSILSLVRAKEALLDRWAKAYDALNTAEIRALQIRIGVATARLRDGARAYGFKGCGQE
jgi:DNA repair ATPase RecN